MFSLGFSLYYIPLIRRKQKKNNPQAAPATPATPAAQWHKETPRHSLAEQHPNTRWQCKQAHDHELQDCRKWCLQLAAKVLSWRRVSFLLVIFHGSSFQNCIFKTAFVQAQPKTYLFPFSDSGDSFSARA